jgi:hypothetical protein
MLSHGAPPTAQAHSATPLASEHEALVRQVSAAVEQSLAQAPS